jgi:hypothetical protein
MSEISDRKSALSTQQSEIGNSQLSSGCISKPATRFRDSRLGIPDAPHGNVLADAYALKQHD